MTTLPGVVATMRQERVAMYLVSNRTRRSTGLTPGRWWHHRSA